MTTPRPASLTPQQHAKQIRDALAALNAAVAAAARDGVGITYEVPRVGLIEGRLPPVEVQAQVWWAL